MDAEGADFLVFCRVERRLADLTCSAYERDVRACLCCLQADGIMSWAEVRPPDLRRFLAAETERRPELASQARTVAALKGFFRFLVENEAIERNPALVLRTPKKSEALPDVLDRRELARSLQAVERDDVDLTRGKETARIVRQFYKGELVDETKTPAGAREIILAPRAARALRELSVAQQVDERENPHALVFPSPRGSYWLDSNFDRRVWQKARIKAKLPQLTFHTLRYFYISMVRAQGLPNAITEQLVSHVDERTHRGYTRPIPGTEPLIRAALASAFNSTPRAGT